MAGLRMRLFKISILIPTRMSAVTPSRRIDRVRQRPGMGQQRSKWRERSALLRVEPSCLAAVKPVIGYGTLNWL